MSDTNLAPPATTSVTPRAPAARRGSGHLYLRGRTYWMKFYVGGRPVYESTHQTKETLAQRVLNDASAEWLSGSRSCRAFTASPTTRLHKISAPTRRAPGSGISMRPSFGWPTWTGSFATIG